MIGKLVSWNVKSINNQCKRLVLRGCFRKWNPSVVCLQETKIDNYTEKVVKGFWGIKNLGWHAISAKGSAGGVLVE